jgi:YidC/Oxa1 family membrane protein insertase
VTMLLYANIFQPLIDVFEAVIKFFHNTAGISWGWSIVLLTVVIRAILLPLAIRQFHSMQKLQRLQPQMKALQAKYKEDKQRQQQEMMRFYKENEVNPLSSCLPLALQIPVFLSLFYMLRANLRTNICPATEHAYQLVHGAGKTVACGVGNHAGFLFIGDLTNNAKGVTLIVLIILYIGTQLGSTLLMAAPTMDKTQRQIMLVMPLFFVIFILRFPAGVIVYWITTNAWTMLQQFVIRRRLGPAVVPGGAPSSDAFGDVSPAPASGAQSGGGLLAGLRKARPEAAPKLAAVGPRARSGGGSGGSSAGTGVGGAAPPRPPRKKKKRSGRRR